MDAVKYLKEKARMCVSVTVGTCPLKPYVVSCCDCDDTADAEMSVHVVEEWSKAHPIQTNADKFKEVFERELNEYGGTPFGHIYGLSAEWWDAPYEAPNYEE